MPAKLITGQIEEKVCKLNAEGLSPYKIHEVLLQEDTIKICRKAIYNYLVSPNNTVTIQKYLDIHRSNPLMVDIAHKKIRLLDMNKVRLRIIATMERYINKEGEIIEKKINKYLSLAKRLVEIEIVGREEIEKKPDLMAYFQRIGPYSEVTDAELDRTKTRIEQRLLIIRSGGKDPLTGIDLSGQGERSSTFKKPS